MFQERCYDRDEINSNYFADKMTNNIDIDVNDYNMQPVMPIAGMSMGMGNVGRPIVEPMQEKIVNRTIMHEVPHVCPLRTKVINHHVYRHTYRPEYSCCEENVCSSINEGSCCNFR